MAAGSSSRMGHNKLGLVIYGISLLENSIKAAINSSAQNVLIVLGANNDENNRISDKFNVGTIVNKNWKNGIGSTIKCGLNSMIEKHYELDAVIISVCDQPYLSSNLFNQLIRKYKESGKQIVASDYTVSIGVPVLYDKSMFANLLQISDKHGAKKHILVHADSGMMTTVPFPKGDVDIDTKEDIKNVKLAPRP